MDTKPFIELPTLLGSEFINPGDIAAICADNKSIVITFSCGKEKQVKLSIGKAEKLFSHKYFVKCHRCHIINILMIKERIKSPRSIKLTNDKIVPLSNTYKANFEQALHEYCKKWGGVNC